MDQWYFHHSYSNQWYIYQNEIQLMYHNQTFHNERDVWYWYQYNMYQVDRLSPS